VAKSFSTPEFGNPCLFCSFVVNSSLSFSGEVGNDKSVDVLDCLVSGFEEESYHCLRALKIGGTVNSHQPSADAGAEHIKENISSVFISRRIDLTTLYLSSTPCSDSSFGDGLWQLTLSVVT